MASGGRYDLRVVQSGAKASRINVAVALDGEKALGSSVRVAGEEVVWKWRNFIPLFDGVSQPEPQP